MRHRVELFVISSPAPLMPSTLFSDKSGQLDGQIYPVIEVGSGRMSSGRPGLDVAPFYLAQGMQRAASVRMKERRKCASRLAGRKPWDRPYRVDRPVSPSPADRTYKEAQGAWDVLPKDQCLHMVSTLCLIGLGLSKSLPFHLGLQIPTSFQPMSWLFSMLLFRERLLLSGYVSSSFPCPPLSFLPSCLSLLSVDRALHALAFHPGDQILPDCTGGA
ncbi:hypothetical protein LY76DRAFT_295381 [Colletotrichum caudatum]|nr:hypothetical protein LY76DRAFT_295381 [Colletotrichum caudatum]